MLSVSKMSSEKEDYDASEPLVMENDVGPKEKHQSLNEPYGHQYLIDINLSVEGPVLIKNS